MCTVGRLDTVLQRAAPTSANPNPHQFLHIHDASVWLQLFKPPHIRLTYRHIHTFPTAITILYLPPCPRNAGWKVRVYTAYGGPLARSEEQTPRELWGPPDNRTLWVNVDPSSPNIINMVYVGASAGRRGGGEVLQS